MEPWSIRLRHLYGSLMILAIQTSLSLVNQGGIGSQTCTSLIYFFMTEIISMDMMLRFQENFVQEIKWWGPPPAGALPDCRIHAGNNLLGILPAKDWAWHACRNITIHLWYRTLTGEFEKVLASQWGAPVSIAVWCASSYSILLFRMSGLHCLSKSFLTRSCSHLPLTFTAFSQSDSIRCLLHGGSEPTNSL